MSLYGAKINNMDTLETYGLCLLADVSISSAVLKENRLDIPGMHGTLTDAYALTGEPVFEDRKIAFSLFKSVVAMELGELRDALAVYHGRQVQLTLPDDPAHYWHGILQLGDGGGYNKGTIPMKMTAYPYKLKHNETVITQDISIAFVSISCTNECMPTIPTITANLETILEHNGQTYVIAANTPYRNTAIRFAAGENIIKAKTSAGTGSLSITYQEGVI